MGGRLGLIELGQIIKQVLEKRKMWRQYRGYLIIEQWELLVGERIAAVTRAQRIHREVLWVKVSDSTWAYHLTLLKPQLIAKVNQHAGDRVIKDIFFQIGLDERF